MNDLPSGWARATLEEIYPLTYGKALPEAARRPGAFGVYGSSGEVGKHSEALTKGPALVVGRKGSVGRAYLSPGPCWPIDTAYFVEAGPHRNLKFGLYLLESLQLDTLDRSTAIPGLSRDDYNSIEVSLPPLNEQARIVAELDKQLTRLDAAVESLQHAKELLKRYRASVLKAACEGRLVPTEAELARREKRDYEPASKFVPDRPKEGAPAQQLPEGWCWAQMRDLAEGGERKSIFAGPFGTIFKARDFRDEGVPIIFLRHVAPGRYLTHKPGFMDRSVWEERFKDEYSVWGGEILVTKLGEPPGVATIFPSSIGPAMVTPDVIAMRPNAGRVAPRYLMHFMNSDAARRVASGLAFGTTRLRLTIPLFRELWVPLPPLREQDRIVSEVETRLAVADASEATIETTRARARALKRSILSRAFEGDLVAQDPSDEPATALLEQIRGNIPGKTARPSTSPRRGRNIEKATA